MKGFEKVKGDRCPPVEAPEMISAEIVNRNNSGGRMLDSVANNMDTILSLVRDVISIQKMRAQSDIMIAEMKAAREQLLAEAEAYVRKKDADTRSAIKRMEIIREMMNDFYNAGSTNIKSEDFCKIITDIVNQIGNNSNGRG